jgi:thymidylate synthase ThyX
MTISAKIIADSISPKGIRLTTMQLRYPKFIHGEFMTHRVFSRNASSSRAIPVERLIQDVIDDPAMPVFWGRNQKGMQAIEEYDNPEGAKRLWLEARDNAVKQATTLHIVSLHKQIVNRVLEPFCHINVVVTATEWANFFALRRHKDAQPEIHALADAMWEAHGDSVPSRLEPGEWHLPYCNIAATSQTDLNIKLSVARCARVSYRTHEGKEPDIEDDLKLYDRLIGSIPLHASPAEHQATPDKCGTIPGQYDWNIPWQHGNFIGWRQYRKTLPNERVRDR